MTLVVVGDGSVGKTSLLLRFFIIIKIKHTIN